MLEFILARYNYWIVIILMMTGLYIVFSRGNLVKTIVGLNLFQTSVFIFYITVGKVAGGTAPILIKSKDDKKDAHGADHGAYGDADQTDDAAASADSAHTASALTEEEAAAYVAGDRANELGAGEGIAQASNEVRESLHTMPDGSAVTNALVDVNAAPGTDAPAPAIAEASQPGIEIISGETADVAPTVNAPPVSELPYGGVVSSPAIGDQLYSNPLPHVLILTAIVVGVATTSVGLAIAVRIREAYGTIEEDALEVLDNAAEFGPKPSPEKPLSGAVEGARS